MGKKYTILTLKKYGMTTLIADKVDSRGKNITRDHEDHLIMIKESIHHKDITILNVCAPNNTASRSMKRKLTKLQGRTDLQLEFEISILFSQ